MKVFLILAGFIIIALIKFRKSLGEVPEEVQTDAEELKKKLEEAFVVEERTITYTAKEYANKEKERKHKGKEQNRKRKQTLQSTEGERTTFVKEIKEVETNEVELENEYTIRGIDDVKRSIVLGEILQRKY